MENHFHHEMSSPAFEAREEANASCFSASSFSVEAAVWRSLKEDLRSDKEPLWCWWLGRVRASKASSSV